MHIETRHPPVGRAPDSDQELRFRHTLPGPMEDIWRRLLTEWLPQWLDVDSIPQMVGTPLRRGGSVRGKVIGCYTGRRLRTRWIPASLTEETILQVTLMDAALLEVGPPGVVLEIQQEDLPGPAAREDLLAHWTAVFDGLDAAGAGAR
ncbi:MAG: hypothetical protein ACTHV2_03405 [Brachybacterium sp.]|uniref:hypothetical protein n=1 Tax=Brachybacterium sp. TaxID=1891286 RepID=UPI00265323C0|nr:hypothetical protein [Brachybacterium sp.]MDN6329539.1 hypothetical protein [Brachybacterium sp.]